MKEPLETLVDNNLWLTLFLFRLAEVQSFKGVFEEPSSSVSSVRMRLIESRRQINNYFVFKQVNT